MMKTIAAYALFTLCAFSAFAQGAGMKQYKSIDGKDWVCTTSAVSLVASANALRLAGDLAGSNNVSAEAVLRLAGDIAGSNNVTALSGTVTALSGGVTASNILFNAWFAGIFPQTNGWNAAFSWGNWADPVASNTAAIAVLQTNTLTRADGLAYVTKEAFSTNQVTRWYDPEDPNRFGQLEGGTNIVIYKAEVSGTNFVVTLGTNFADITIYPTKPDWDTYVFPFEWSGTWAGTMSSDVPPQLALTGIDGALWNGTASAYPVDLIPANAGAQGTATVSIASFNLTTNVEWRYFLPTNAIPPELANLDALQGWLNNLYAGKAAFDGHVTDGTHTNVTLAGTVTIGGVARTDWPAGTPGAITNNGTATLGLTSVIGDGSRGAASGVLTIKTAANQNARLNVGFEPGLGAYMQSIILGAGYTPIILQYGGGNVLVGTSTDTGEKLQVNGTVKATSIRLFDYGTSAYRTGTLTNGVMYWQ